MNGLYRKLLTRDNTVLMHQARAIDSYNIFGSSRHVTLYFIISDDLKTEIVESTKVVCEHYGIKYVQLQGIEKESGHPTVKGMETIANQVLTLIK